MRLQLQISPPIKPVPFDYLHHLTGALHKWIGQNDIHDGLSLYNFGWLQGAEVIGKSLYFSHGASWTISFHDESLAYKMAKGILKDPELAWGMKIEKAIEVDVPSFNYRCRFAVDGVVVIRTPRSDGSRQYLLWNDPQADEALTRILNKKLEKAGYDIKDTIKVSFDRSYKAAKTKLITIKGIQHKGSICPIIVEAPPQVQRFVWLVGVGELTGSGCGALK